MNNFLYIWVLCCFISIQSYPQKLERPVYVECESSEECGFDKCCVLGMGRYSTPTCQARLHLYEACRPASQEPVNSTVAYLDGKVVNLYNIHMIMCPCANGLVCDHKSGRCEDFDSLGAVNEIYDVKYPED